MKKQCIIPAFGEYVIFNDNTIVKKDGTKIQPNSKNKVTLVASADDAELGVTVGQKVTMTMDDLNTLCADKWVDSEVQEEFDINAGTEQPKAEPAKAEPAKTEEQIKAKEHKAKTKELKKKLDAASKNLLNAMTTSDKAAIDKAGEEFRAADAEYKAHTNTVVANAYSEEEKAIIEQYESLKYERDELRSIAEKHNDAMKEMKSKLPTGYKAGSTASTGTGEAVPQRAPKLNYDIAQNIREDVGRKGMSKSDAAKKYGVTVAAVNYICIYEHYKLKAGDTDFMLPIEPTEATA